MPKRSMQNMSHVFMIQPAFVGTVTIIRDRVPGKEERFVLSHAELQQIPGKLGCSPSDDWTVELVSATGITDEGLVRMTHTNVITYSAPLDTYIIEEKRMPSGVRDYQLIFAVS